MKTTRLLTLFFLLILAVGANAQMVSPVGLGIRVNPDGAGITGKFFLDKYWAVEGQLNASGGFNTPDDGSSVTAVGLLEYHFILPDPSWRIFLGPGAHFGSWDRYSNGWDGGHHYNAQGIVGIDGILGVEYVFKKAPIGLSADIKPAMNFASDVAFFPNNFFGISARYYLGHKIPAPPTPPGRRQ